ncbi:MAG: lipid II:glycine glycyltransferase FemX [Ancrocorticia sp.]|uniref:lipid II:glycine glycyltransferase FemX n=1 Tax=Ancrocorticia sp. TaxID=2593684 RepID=UPI003F8E5A56
MNRELVEESPMRFVELAEQDYEQFVRSSERCFFTQLPAYGDVRSAEGYRVERVGLCEGETILAAATVVYQPWKKAFLRAHISYGPVVSGQGEEKAAVTAEFFEKLRQHIGTDKRVLSIRVTPLVVRRFYEGSEPGPELDEAREFDALMETMGAQRLDKEFYDSADVQVRFSYVKDIAGMSFKEAAASCGQVVRTGFNRAGTNGVEVRFYGPDQFDVLEKVLQHTAERTDMHAITDSAFHYYRDLMKRLGPDEMMMPVAVLNTVAALDQIQKERETIIPKVERISDMEAAAEAEGRALGKKQRNQLKEQRSRLEVLERREKETLSVREEHGDEIVLGASLFVHSPHELVYLVSGAYAEFQSYYGIYLIHRAMFEWATSHDVHRYNMYGVTGDFSEDASDAGVLHFKSQFQGYVEEYVGTYDLVLHNKLASALGAVG